MKRIEWSPPAERGSLPIVKRYSAILGYPTDAEIRRRDRKFAKWLGTKHPVAEHCPLFYSKTLQEAWMELDKILDGIRKL